MHPGTVLSCFAYLVLALVATGCSSRDIDFGDHGLPDVGVDAPSDIFPVLTDGLFSVPLPEFKLASDARPANDLCNLGDVGPKQHELVHGDQWPVHITILDASDSMNWPVLGSGQISAFTVVKQALATFYGRTLPVRHGLVVFHTTIAASVPPPATNSANTLAISNVLSTAKAEQATNTAAGLEQARKMMASSTCAFKTVTLITDGEPTRAAGCPKQSICAFTKAQQEAALVRVRAGAALIPLEIRRTNYILLTSKLLLQMAGQAGTGGGDGTLYFSAKDRPGVDRFLKKMTRRICSVGPLVPAPSSAQKVSVFLQSPLSRVSNVDLVPTSPGYEVRTTKTGTFVLLTLHSCEALGSDPKKRVVVRWTG